ncbi:hypothetical protein BDDG_02752 [Blastomyces dermatitidis ATCC 18188]|uniref:Uncharacterized protein n=1 Tax=Ajellomyces dermatitidis (strain ATCC 18188 / CBS 674.68) TaxID=653446 RepID=F2T998_AJEDA|nr:hypothetical protein BDDG_02752 [Blastomyces dermatitidis ATCC 18188]
MAAPSMTSALQTSVVFPRGLDLSAINIARYHVGGPGHLPPSPSTVVVELLAQTFGNRSPNGGSTQSNRDRVLFPVSDLIIAVEGIQEPPSPITGTAGQVFQLSSVVGSRYWLYYCGGCNNPVACVRPSMGHREQATGKLTKLEGDSLRHRITSPSYQQLQCLINMENPSLSFLASYRPF